MSISVDLIIPPETKCVILPEGYNYEFTENTFHNEVKKIYLNDEYNKPLKYLPKKLISL